MEYGTQVVISTQLFYVDINRIVFGFFADQLMALVLIILVRLEAGTLEGEKGSLAEEGVQDGLKVREIL